MADKLPKSPARMPIPTGRAVGSEPFRQDEPSDEEAARAFFNKHDLREMYTRENTERRRVGGHTLRRYLTTAQDKALTARMVKIRDEWQVWNNDDVVLAFAQELVATGKEAELNPKLAAAAKKAHIPKRTTPVYKPAEAAGAPATITSNAPAAAAKPKP